VLRAFRDGGSRIGQCGRRARIRARLRSRSLRRGARAGQSAQEVEGELQGIAHDEGGRRMTVV
jgi:hypothetical protein